jgi:hypothetical protein
MVVLTLTSRCPDRVKAYMTLTQALFFDHSVRHLSGDDASSIGGLAISQSPPSTSFPQACIKWMEWLRKVFAANDLATLTPLMSARPEHFMLPDGEVKVDPKAPSNTDLTLEEIEIAQLVDLGMMRSNPQNVPYRRFIYIGEMSLAKETREKFGSTVRCFRGWRGERTLMGSD